MAPLVLLGFLACFIDLALLAWLLGILVATCFTLVRGRRVAFALLALVVPSPLLIPPVMGVFHGIRSRVTGASPDWQRARLHPDGFEGLDLDGRFYHTNRGFDMVGISEATWDARYLAEYFTLHALSSVLGPAPGSYLGELPSQEDVENAIQTRGFVARVGPDRLILTDGGTLPMVQGFTDITIESAVVAACGPASSGSGCEEADWVAIGAMSFRESVRVVSRRSGQPLLEYRAAYNSAFGAWLTKATMWAAIGKPIPPPTPKTPVKPDD